MPGLYNGKQATARIPPQAQRFRQSACPLSRAFRCDYGTLGSNPRKSPNQSKPLTQKIKLKPDVLTIPYRDLKRRDNL
jgi:hypothetical protein